ncbi:MAG: MFS transporter [Allosphingosinicella sp.]
MSTTSESSSEGRTARSALAALSLAMLMPSLGTSIANIGLPALVASFAVSFREAQWVILAYLLAMTAVILGAGRLGDAVGRRRLLLAGIALFTAASALCAASPTLELLILARAVQGVGAAVMTALSIAMVGDVVPERRTGSAIGLLGSMSAAGTTLGPAAGGLLIARFGWPAIFLINVPLGVVGFVLALRVLPNDPARRAAGPIRAPVVRPGLLRDRTLCAALAANGLVATVIMATLVVGPFYLASAYGLGPAAVGAAMAAGPLVAALAGAPAGRLVDRFGADGSIGVALLGMAAGLTALAAAVSSVAGYVAAVALVTAGYALFQAANGAKIMRRASPGERGTVSGMLNLSRNLGLMAGTSAMGGLYVRAGMSITFAAAAILVGLAFAICAGDDAALKASRRAAAAES